MRFLDPLSNEDTAALEQLYNYAVKPTPRRRAHAILLGSKQFSIKKIAAILDVTRETVGIWFNCWEAHGLKSLHDKTRSGRKAIYDDAEILRLEVLLKESPHQLKTAQAKLEQETGKQSSKKTLKRALKKSL